MEKTMKKTWVILLVTALCLTQAKLYAEEDILAANQNFGPRKGEVAPQPTPVVTPTAKPTPPPAAVQPAPAPAVTVAPTAVQDEVIRRQEAQLVARKMIDEGQKLYHDGKYAEAIAKLEAALKVLPKAPATEVELQRANHSLTESYFQLADAAYRAQDNAKAKEYATKALQYDSDNTKAENILVKVKWAEREKEAAARRAKAEGITTTAGPTPDETPEFVAKKNQIKRLFREAKLLTSSGQYDEAEKRYKQILLLDSYNDDAYRHMRNLNEQRLASADWAREAVHSHRMWEVADAWTPPLGPEIRLPELTQPKPIGFSKEQTAVLEKLNKITFPEVNFREAVISDVVSFLSSKSRELDPEKVGINIVLGAGVPAAAPGEAATPAPSGVRPVTLSLRNVPMVEVLKYVCSLAYLKYRVEANAVLILPIDAVDATMVTRSYPVNSSTIKPLLATPAITTQPIGGGGGEFRGMGGTEMTAPSGDIKQFFVDAGVPFPAGASLSFNERTSKITIRNTPENMEIFERVLADLNVIPNQVEIEAKFVDLSEGDLKELGFNWYVGSNKQLTFFQAGQAGTPAGTQTNIVGGVTNITDVAAVVGGLLTSGLRNSGGLPGSAVESLLTGAAQGGTLNNMIGTFTSFLSRPDLSVVISALAQRKGTDVLSAPKITTISGAQAQVRVVQEFIYPTEYSTPSAGANVVTPSIPSAFRTREVGVILNVTPTVGPDGYTINLTLVPEVSEFRGFIDYSPGDFQQNVGGTNITVNYKIQQPLFETRNVQTSVVIWDGQTVVLGGLMREDVSKLDDKVPLLGDIPVIGRLFRSKVTSRSKRNLLIFVTANLVDPAGNKIHRQDVTAVTAK
jgi:general secretion pathway protein D